MSLSESQRKHAALRFLHRTGMRLTDRVRAELLRQVQQEGSRRFINRRGSFGRFRVTLPDGSDAVAVYSKRSKEIVTVWRDGDEDAWKRLQKEREQGA